MKHLILQACGCPKYYCYKNFSGKFIEFDKTRIITPLDQKRDYKKLLVDSTGWLCFISTPSFLTNAGLLASDIASNYLHNGLSVKWISPIGIFDYKNKDNPIQTNLLVIDCIFTNGNPSIRDSLYAAITQLYQSDDTSIIIIGQAPNPKSLVSYIGLKPTYTFQV